MIALDLDGTLLDYSPEGPSPRVNRLVLESLHLRRVRAVAILTNQGGLPYGVAGKLRRDGRPYPTPVQFIARLRCARVALSEYGIVVAHLRVSLWHAYADAAAIRAAATQVRGWLDVTEGMQWCVYTTERARKPSPLMLHSVGATEYWGDSPEDAVAAANAGIPFVPIVRFL